MKNLIVISMACFIILFVSCKQETLETQTIEQNQKIDGTETLPDPFEGKHLEAIDESGVLFEPLETGDETPQMKLADIPLDAKDNSTASRSSCEPHYDFPVFYNLATGRFRVEDHTNPCAGGPQSPTLKRSNFERTGYTLMIGMNEGSASQDHRGYYMAYANSGRMKVGTVDRYGVRRTLKEFQWVDYWTHLTPIQDNMFVFYSSTQNGSIYIGKVTSSGLIQTVRSYGSWRTDWTHFEYLGDGKLLTYSNTSGKLYVNQIDGQGNWRILKATNIGMGWDEVTALGKQEKKRDGVCCFPLGTGFMVYDRDLHKLNVYVVKRDFGVSRRIRYYTTGFRFDIIKQIDGNKFMIYDQRINRVDVGQISRLGIWVWEHNYLTDAGFYTNIFPMTFK